MSVFNYHKEQLKAVIQKYLQGEATSKESEFLEEYYVYFDNKEDVLKDLSQEAKQLLRDKMWQQIENKIRSSEQIIRLPWYKKTKWIAAASVIIAIASALLIFYPNNTNKQIAVQNIAPATDKAILKLSDGRTIMLDSNNAELTSEGNVSLSLKDGNLIYEGSSGKVLKNIMSTPRGGQHRLTLADGTKVWLNAQSSIEFPAAFVGNERNVTLSGEAYFEVSKSSKPFKVNIPGKTVVEVLGTHFNINAYTPVVAATLLEGKVKVMPYINNIQQKQNSKIIYPGQQAVVEDAGIRVNSDVDMSEIMAWKEKMFYYENTPLEDILAEFSRWYDVDVDYQCAEPIKKRKFFMIINRNEPLQEVLKNLESNDIKFSMDGKKIIVK